MAVKTWLFFLVTIKTSLYIIQRVYNKPIKRLYYMRIGLGDMLSTVQFINIMMYTFLSVVSIMRCQRFYKSIVLTIISVPFKQLI